MTWVKLDDGFPDHRKLAELGDYAPLCAWLFICGLAFCNRQLTDGIIPKAHVFRLASFRHISIATGGVKGLFQEDIDTDALATMLVDVGLWEDKIGYYRVHHYLDYNPSRADVLALRNARSDAGRLGGQHSWDTRRRSSTRATVSALAEASADTSAKAKSNPVPDPVPYNDHINNDHPDHVPVITAKPSPRKRGNTQQTEYSPEFEQFWASYPRKDGKWAAWLEWGKRLKGGDSPMRLIAASVNLASAVDADPNWEIGRVWHARTFVGPQRLYQDYVSGIPESARRNQSGTTERQPEHAGDAVRPATASQFAKYGRAWADH